jgi:hypothetical protein
MGMGDVTRGQQPFFRVGNQARVKIGVAVNCIAKVDGNMGPEMRIVCAASSEVASLESWIEADNRYRGATGIVGERIGTTIFYRAYRESSNIMVTVKYKRMPNNGPIGLQEDTDSSRCSEPTMRNPNSRTSGSKEQNMAVWQFRRRQKSELSYLRYSTCPRRIAANGCYPPDVQWIGPHCVEAQ